MTSTLTSNCSWLREFVNCIVETWFIFAREGQRNCYITFIKCYNKPLFRSHSQVGGHCCTLQPKNMLVLLVSNDDYHLHMIVRCFDPIERAVRQNGTALSSWRQITLFAHGLCREMIEHTRPSIVTLTLRRRRQCCITNSKAQLLVTYCAPREDKQSTKIALHCLALQHGQVPTGKRKHRGEDLLMWCMKQREHGGGM